MNRRIAFGLCFAALVAGRANAQNAEPKGAALEAAKKTWVGLWEGPVWHIGESDPIGGFRLEIAHDSAWKVTIDVVTGQTISGRGAEFAPNGSRATWKTSLMDQACNASAVVDGAVLKGEITCSEHGGLTFELRKKQL